MTRDAMDVWLAGRRRRRFFVRRRCFLARVFYLGPAVGPAAAVVASGGAFNHNSSPRSSLYVHVSLLTSPLSLSFPMMGETSVASMCTPSRGWNRNGHKMSHSPRNGSSYASPWW